LAESIPYEGRLPDGSAAVESETAIIRAVFGYGSVKSMVAAASRSAELEAEQDSAWRMALIKMALGQSAYLSGDISTARKSLDEALAVITADQPLWRIGALYLVSVVATDEGRLEEAESLAREARSLVEEFIPRGSRETSAVSIALVGRLTRVSPFFHDAPTPSYRPSRTGSATSQSMTTLSSASPAQRPATAPLKRGRVPVPATGRGLQPLDDLFGLARMLSSQRTPNEDALDRLIHVQPTASKRCVEYHHPLREHPQ